MAVTWPVQLIFILHQYSTNDFQPVDNDIWHRLFCSYRSFHCTDHISNNDDLSIIILIKWNSIVDVSTLMPWIVLRLCALNSRIHKYYVFYIILLHLYFIFFKGKYRRVLESRYLQQFSRNCQQLISFRCFWLTEQYDFLWPIKNAHFDSCDD